MLSSLAPTATKVAKKIYKKVAIKKTSKVGDISEQNQNQDQIQNENQAEYISTDDKIDSDKNAK